MVYIKFANLIGSLIIDYSALISPNLWTNANLAF